MEIYSYVKISIIIVYRFDSDLWFNASLTSSNAVSQLHKKRVAIYNFYNYYFRQHRNVTSQQQQFSMTRGTYVVGCVPVHYSVRNTSDNHATKLWFYSRIRIPTSEYFAQNRWMGKIVRGRKKQKLNDQIIYFSRYILSYNYFQHPPLTIKGQ